MSALLAEPDRETLRELAPLLRRAVDLDPRAVARLRLSTQRASALVRPFGVLVSRTVVPDAATPADAAAVRDLTVGAAALLAWVDGEAGEPPGSRDADWRGGLPPESGWHRLDSVPDDAIRPLVRQGALTLKDAAAREGVPGAQPRQEVADALLDSVVLQVSDPGGADAELTLRAVSALTRMGFLPRGGRAHVDVAGRWVRLVGAYGTVYLERPGSGLGLLAR